MKLAPGHFKAPEAEPVSSLPVMKDLGARLAGGIATAFAEMGQGAWRAVLEGIVEDAPRDGEDEGTWIRIETRTGSVAIRILLDRPALSAICEVAMGGAGAEEAVNFAERPLSNIETELSRIATARLTDMIVAVLAEKLAMPVSLFDGPAIGFAQGSALPGRLLTFRFLVNVFDYSGEVRLTAISAGLKRQFDVLQAATSEVVPIEEQRAALQRQIGEAEAALTVALGPESILVEELAAIRPGALLKLNATTHAPVTVASAGVPVFTGTLARAGDRLAVRLTYPAP